MTVTANTTVRPTVRFENLGGAAGTLAQIDVVDTSDSHFESRITINVQMPQIRVEGSIRAGGSGITSQASGLDLATVAFLISFLAIIGAAVYLAVLRRRSR